MTTTSRPDLSVLTVPAFNDNYIWLIHDGTHAAVVDPGDAGPVREALAAHKLSLTAILLTHHHADHIGGVASLLAEWRGPGSMPVYGPRNDGIASVTEPLDEGDHFQVAGLDLALDVLEVPGHTLGHIAFVRRAPGADWLFCGDTLFAGGCGRLFEGTPAQMADSLAKLAALPEETLVYCAHEYTVANLKFAQAVEPGNQGLALRMVDAAAKRGTRLPTVPSTIGLEKGTNPFLRCTEPGIVKSLVDAGRMAADASPLQAFAALREWKNVF